MNYYSWAFDSLKKKSVWDFFAKNAFTEEQAKGRFSPERAMIVDMSPDLFLALAEPIKKDDAKRHENLGDKIENGEIKRFDTIPALLMRIMEDSDDAKVYGHDGRHRAILLKNDGFVSIPVALYWDNATWERLPVHKDGSRFFPKELWCQNDKNAEREIEKIPFPVLESDWGRPYDLINERPDGNADMTEEAVAPEDPGEKMVVDATPFDGKVPDECAKTRNNFTNNGNRPFYLPFTSYAEFLMKNN